jgi:hypothetical protein
MSEPSSFLEVAGKLSLALALVAFNGFFVAAEFALVKIRDTQLEGYIQRRGCRDEPEKRPARLYHPLRVVGGNESGGGC